MHHPVQIHYAQLYFCCLLLVTCSFVCIELSLLPMCVCVCVCVCVCECACVCVCENSKTTHPSVEAVTTATFPASLGPVALVAILTCTKGITDSAVKATDLQICRNMTCKKQHLLKQWLVGHFFQKCICSRYWPPFTSIVKIPFSDSSVSRSRSTSVIQYINYNATNVISASPAT